MQPSAKRATAVLVATSVLVTVFGAVDAGAGRADDPTTTAPTAEATTSVVDSTGPTTTLATDAPTTTIGPGGFGPPPTDPDAPPEPPMPDPSPQVRILLSQLLGQEEQELRDHHADVALVHDADIARYVDLEQDARDVLVGSRAELTRIDDLIAEIREELRAEALARYMNPGTTGLEYLVATSDDSGRTRSVLSDVAIEVRLDERADALAERKRIKAQIATDSEAVSRAEDATAEARGRAAKAAERAEKELERFRDDQDLTLEANREFSRADVALEGPASDWSLPIVGRSVFTPEELADWFHQRGVASRAAAPISELAEYYIDEGADQKIRGDMAFAQSVLETGSFTNRDTILLNNFAGIGHCDTCPQGFGFASPHLGVRAQIQLLADYVERNPDLAHPLVDRRLRGPSGCCQTWWDLTHTWATAGNYGPKIMGIYREMLHWLVIERGMTPQVSAR